MKKKLLCAAMIMIMVLGTLVMTGCGGSSDKSADKDTLVVGLDDTCILWRRGTPNFERDRSIPGNVI